MKKVISLWIIWISGLGISLACPVCERNQPKIFRGIVHGQGPESQWDYPIIIGVIIIVLVTACLSVKWMLRPGEQNKQHIKRSILEE